MKWRALIWVAVVIAAVAAVVLAVDVAVAGAGKATGLAGVIVGFCELAALVVGVAGWAGERQAGAVDRDARGDPKPASPGTGVHMKGEASGHGRVYQAGRDQTINEK